MTPKKKQKRAKFRPGATIDGKHDPQGREGRPKPLYGPILVALPARLAGLDVVAATGPKKNRPWPGWPEAVPPEWVRMLLHIWLLSEEPPAG